MILRVICDNTIRWLKINQSNHKGTSNFYDGTDWTIFEFSLWRPYYKNMTKSFTIDTFALFVHLIHFPNNSPPLLQTLNNNKGLPYRNRRGILVHRNQYLYTEIVCQLLGRGTWSSESDEVSPVILKKSDIPLCRGGKNLGA